MLALDSRFRGSDGRGPVEFRNFLSLVETLPNGITGGTGSEPKENAVELLEKRRPGSLDGKLV
jgi:hypothetical protein